MISAALSGLYRARMVLFAVAIALIVAGTVASVLLPRSDARTLLALLPLAGCVLMLTSLGSIALAARRRGTDAPPIRVTAPVAGRWLGMNSPTSQVPSHGVRAYGQSHAIDLVAEPLTAQRPQFGSGAGMRLPQDFPAFGEPVFSMIDGVVVAASDGQRDHRSRSTGLAVAYMMLEGAVRELGGPRFIVGNHVTVRSSDGNYALIAHIRKRSLRVRVGDRVTAGQQLAECGNSGNSSEPHVHAQLMDRASLWTAQGLPLVFTHATISSATHASNPESSDALPANGEHLRAARPLTARPADPVA